MKRLAAVSVAVLVALTGTVAAREHHEAVQARRFAVQSSADGLVVLARAERAEADLASTRQALAAAQSVADAAVQRGQDADRARLEAESQLAQTRADADRAANTCTP